MYNNYTQPVNKQPAKQEEVVGQKFDQDKLRYDLVEPEFEEEVADVLTYGAAKYAPNSWRNVPDAKNRYYAALRRHIAAWRKGEEIDPESGKSHLAHAACNLMFLMHKGEADEQ